MGTQLLTVGSHALTPLSLTVLLTAVVIGGIGLYPLLGGEPLQESLFFFLMCLSCAVWLTGFAAAYGAPNRVAAFQWIRLAYLGVPLIPAGLYTVTLHVLGFADQRRASLGVAWGLAAAFVVLLSGTGVIIEGVRRFSWGYYPRYSPAGASFVAFTVGGIGASLREYWLRYRHAPREDQRRRAGLYLMAFALGSLAVVDFLPCYGLEVVPAGFVAILGMSGVVGHTIRNYHLTELTPAFAASHILETLSDPVVVCNREGEIEVANDAATAGLGYGVEELVGRPLHTLIQGAGPSSDGSSHMLIRREVRDEEMRLTAKDGSAVDVSVSSSILEDQNGRRVGTAVVARDIEERKELEEQLRHRALHDPLTDLPNRALLREQIKQSLARSRRRGHPVGLLMVDIDRFKRVNDNLGHTAGDHVLREIARRLREAVRSEDAVARWGGDEFVVLLPELAGADGMAAVVDRIRAAVHRPLEAGGESLRLDISVGAVLRDEGDDPRAVETEDPEELIRLADLALNTAKHESPGGVHRFDPAAEVEGRDRLRLEQDLRRALEAGEITARYQPIVWLEDGSPAGVEVLARWQHPHRGLVSPGEFIPLAEEIGLIGELGETVFREGCARAADWFRIAGHRPGFVVHFNVSGSQFEDPDLPEELDRWIREAGLPSDSVILEVTETTLMQATPQVDALQGRGLQIYVDDFGTGYSTFTYLRDLDVDGLKIDMTFVHGVAEDDSDAALVETILTLSEKLDLSVVAEGVETRAQRDELRKLGCELGQGFFFARPMDAGEVAGWLSSR